MEFEHTPVMLREVLEHQTLKPGNICVDCTLGGANHALATLKKIIPNGFLIGIDQDMDAINYAQKKLSDFKENILLVHSKFSDLEKILNSRGIKGVNSILLDLGLSLNQLKNSKRGFSFNKDEMLDMRMNTQDELTAFEIINSFSKNELTDIFFKFGEERFSKKAAKKIAAARNNKPIQTSLELAKIISQAVPVKHNQRIHPATRIFQALRIAVNKELEQLEKLIKIAPSLLLKGGTLCIITFHSLEDRIVKQTLRKFESNCTCPDILPVCSCGFVQQMKSIFKKPLVPKKEEIRINPMARSAKLRIAKKVSNSNYGFNTGHIT